MMRYFAYFIIFGLLGWALDTTYRIFAAHEKRGNTYVPYFAIVYGIGGVLLLMLYEMTAFTAIEHIFIGTIAVTFLEFFAGVFCVKVLHSQLWNYSTSKYNLFGHVDLLHTTYWFILATILRLIFPRIVL